MKATYKWKIVRKKDTSHSAITYFVDILSRDMLNYAYSLLEDDVPEVANNFDVTTSNSGIPTIIVDSIDTKKIT